MYVVQRRTMVVRVLPIASARDTVYPAFVVIALPLVAQMVVHLVSFASALPTVDYTLVNGRRIMDKHALVVVPARVVFALAATAEFVPLTHTVAISTALAINVTTTSKLGLLKSAVKHIAQAGASSERAAI